MTERETTRGMDFEALRRAIEGGDPDSMLAFYAHDARVRVLNGAAAPFELRSKVEIHAYLRTVFGPPTTHRVRNEVVGQERITFEDICGYPDGARIVVATTLEVRGGEILHQLDVVSDDVKTGPEEAENPAERAPERIAEERGRGENSPFLRQRWRWWRRRVAQRVREKLTKNLSAGQVRAPSPIAKNGLGAKRVGPDLRVTWTPTGKGTEKERMGTKMIAQRNEKTATLVGQGAAVALLAAVVALAVALFAYGTRAAEAQTANTNTVVAWGFNGGGQTNIPSGLSGVTAVAGGYHSLALKEDGTVVAWGSNSYGQATVPSGLSDVKAVAAGRDHSLALKEDGTVVAWGYNGSAGTSTVPSGLSGVTDVAAGAFHNLALKEDGTVVAWGQGDDGQTTVPSGLSGVTDVSAGDFHSIALKDDGTVVGWGYDFFGQATSPSGLSGVKAVSAGGYHNLALKADGTVVGWGSNSSGVATSPSGLSGVKAVSAGAFHNLALKEDGTVVAWGSSSNGRTTIPLSVSGEKAVAIAAGHDHSLAVVSPAPPGPPGPVESFAATAGGDGRVNLSWTNPQDSDFEAVRVLRSASAAATSPEPDADQTQVYEGKVGSFSDTGLTNGATYHYTAFAKDRAGNWSVASSATARPPDATFTVTNTDDSGAGSLRQAITRANANTNPGYVDTIDFDVPAATDPGCDAASGVCTISPASELPAITQAMSIDGYSQSGASPNTLAAGNDAQLKIELSGEDAGSGANGITITGSNSAVKGLTINRWGADGIEVRGSGASGNRIEGNYIGTGASGTQDLGNFNGVQILNAPNTVVGGASAAARNLISANRQDGVGVEGGASGNNKIEGNYIGTDASGKGDLGNHNGVRIIDAPSNVVGGTAAGARNLISANDASGIFVVVGGASGNRIEGNYIGTDASGKGDLGNSSFGVAFNGAPDNVVGGTSAGARNLISGNGGDGVLVNGGGASGNKIEGNYIGTDASGTADLGNFNGVQIGDAPNNVVGGTTTAARNLISGSTFNGVLVNGGDASGNRIEGNYIGTAVSGTGDLGNSARGVWINGAPSNVVGGTAAGARNIISANDDAGVLVDGATGNRILRNSIFDNGKLGIDLNGGTQTAGGVTANDAGDADTGPNRLQNYPLITSVTTFGGQTTVQGTLNSTANDAFNLQFFSGPAADPSSFGEGKTFVGQTNVLTNSNGNVIFSVTTTTPLAGGQLVTATATNAVTDDTSEFSRATEVEDNTPPPPQCSDGLDNDNDGKTDFGGANADPGCASSNDDSESPDPPPADTTAPTVVAMTPADRATGVAPRANVTATFSEAMDKASVEARGTFTLAPLDRRGRPLSPVRATASYDAATKTLTLDPSADLSRNTAYAATLTTAAKDSAGNALARYKTWTFTTARR